MGCVFGACSPYDAKCGEEECGCEVRFCFAVLVTAAAPLLFIHPGDFEVPERLLAAPCLLGGGVK